MNFQMFKLDVERAEEPGIKLQTFVGSLKKQEKKKKRKKEKAREFQKNIYFCFIDYVKAFDCVDHNKLWKILKEKEKTDNFTSLLRNLYAGEEATIRTGHATTESFQIGKGVCQDYILSPDRKSVV